MSRQRRAVPTAFGVLTTALIILLPAGPAAGQFHKKGTAFGGACGPRQGFVLGGPRLGGGFSPFGGTMSPCNPHLIRPPAFSHGFRNPFCRPAVAPVFVTSPFFSSFDSTAFYYPSSRLEATGYGPGQLYRNTVQVASVPASAGELRGVTTPYNGPPRVASTPQIYGFRTEPAQGGGGDQAVADALRELKHRGDESPPETGGSTEQERAQQVGIALGRGDKDFENGNYLQAREEYSRAMVLAGEDAGVLISFGLAQFALAHYPNASRAMQQAVARPDPLDPASIDLRQAYGRAGDFERHLERLESHLRSHPRDAQAHFLLGFIQACTGRPAAATFEKYLALPGADPAMKPFIARVRK